MTSLSLESSKALKGNIKFWRPPTLFFSLIIFPHFPPLFLCWVRVGKRQLRETQNSQMFQKWKSSIKVFPHISREVGKTVFLWNSQSQNDWNIPGFCIHHSLLHFLSQKPLFYLVFMPKCRALPWWSYSLWWGDRCRVRAETAAQRGEMTCLRSYSGAMTQVISNNIVVSVKV